MHSSCDIIQLLCSFPYTVSHRQIRTSTSFSVDVFYNKKNKVSSWCGWSNSRASAGYATKTKRKKNETKIFIVRFSSNLNSYSHGSLQGWKRTKTYKIFMNPNKGGNNKARTKLTRRFMCFRSTLNSSSIIIFNFHFLDERENRWCSNRKSYSLRLSW